MALALSFRYSSTASACSAGTRSNPAEPLHQVKLLAALRRDYWNQKDETVASRGSTLMLAGVLEVAPGGNIAIPLHRCHPTMAPLLQIRSNVKRQTRRSRAHRRVLMQQRRHQHVRHLRPSPLPPAHQLPCKRRARKRVR
ncbi:hypothetical protein PLICRDRAFT_628000 [Plicaturopsis crispa FD-325 SS-3]|nr:hypothetical protein PLICRDRAFT_628000 [Plicaturopsis crispa FD-325 SS-3]